MPPPPTHTFGAVPLRVRRGVVACTSASADPVLRQPHAPSLCLAACQACFFQALRKARLAEDPAKSDYARCGRTDKGVSALGQVLSIRLRCNSAVGLGVVVKETATAYWAAQKDNPNKKSSPAEEINYVDVINRVLPQDIRVLAWAPVAPEFNARFSCRHRTYKYYFISDAMHLEVRRPRLALPARA